MAWNDVLNGELWGKIRSQINSPGIGPDGDNAIQPGRKYSAADWAAGVETEPGLIAPVDLIELQQGLSMAQAFVQFSFNGSYSIGDNFNYSHMFRDTYVHNVFFAQAIDRPNYQILVTCNEDGSSADSNQGNMHARAISQTQVELIWVGGGGSNVTNLEYVSLVVI